MNFRRKVGRGRQLLDSSSLGGVLLRLGLALALTAIALWVTVKLPPYQTPISYSFMTAAVAVCAYFGGWRTGVLTIILAGTFTAWRMLPPNNSLAISDRGDLLRFSGFLFSAFLICALIARLHSSRQALRLTQDALRVTRRRIEYVERHAKVWTWEYDLRTNRVSWSNLYGNNVSRREQSLNDWLQMVHEEDRDRVAAALKRSLSRGEFEAQFRIMLGDSQPRWLLARAQLVLVDGQPAALVGINMDASFHGDAPAQLPSEQPEPAAHSS
jgi:K+-sensing histidine kinase KdpD